MLDNLREGSASMKAPKYAVQIVTDNKADLFETLEEAVRYCYQLTSQGFEVKVYILGPLNVITKDQKS